MKDRAKRSVRSSLGAGTRIGSPRQPAARPMLHATCHRTATCDVAGTVLNQKPDLNWCKLDGQDL